MNVGMTLKPDNGSDFHIPKCLPLGTWKQSSRTEGIRCFCVKLNSIQNTKNESANGDSFQCQVILYDLSHLQFVGNLWVGKVLPIKNGKITLNETIYFYTSLSVEDVLLCVEMKCIGGSEKITAWTALNMINVKEKEVQTSMQYKVPLLFGSPLALLFMGSNLSEKMNQVDNVSGFELSCSLSTHPILMRLVHLIPENFLISAFDSLAGLLQSRKDSAIVSDGLKRPQLQKCRTVVLSRMTIKLSPSLEVFEAEVLKRIAEENEVSDVSEAVGEVSISQRHLLVGVHNGLCYVQESDSYRLLVEPVITSQIQSKDHKLSSSSSTASYTREESLVVRSDVKIPNVPDDPGVFITFVVEYGFSFQNQASNVISGSSIGRNQSSSVMLLWGACSLSTLRRKQFLAVSLQNNPSHSPNRMLYLKTFPSHSFTLSCSVLSSAEKGSFLLPPKMEGIHQHGSTTSVLASSVPSSLHQLSCNNLSQGHRSASHSVLRSDAMPVYQTEPFPLRKSDSESEIMDEVDVMPSSLPLIPPTIHVFSGQQHFPRAVYAKLFAPNFPTIFDQHGQTPSTIDSSAPYVVDEKKEIRSIPEGHRFVFVFLGISGQPAIVPSTLYFTFQFYRFPYIRTENLLVKVVEANSPSTSKLHIFYPSASNADDFPGFQITYCLDPSDLNVGENKALLRSFIKGNFIIDLWDAKSLFYYGSVRVPLKYLCRQGKEAVCTTLDLEIMHLQFPDDSPGPRIPFLHECKGQLHLRLASIKTSLTAKSLSKLKDMALSDSPCHKIESKRNGACPRNLVSKASPILETNKELAKLMTARSQNAFGQEQSVLTEERRQKLARMEAVRSQLGNAADVISLTKDVQSYFRERQKDLMVIESYIEKHKVHMIQALLHASITSVKYINAVQGECCFFEFELHNPFDSDQSIQISFKFPGLSLVTSSDEWQELRNQTGTTMDVENNLLSTNNGKPPTVFVRSRESVLIPFKYQIQTVNLQSSVSPLKASTGHFLSPDALIICESMPHSETKVSFIAGENNLIAALNLSIQPLPPSNICQSFKFLSPEHSVFQKSMVIKHLTHHPDLVASDPDVVCEFLPSDTRHGASSSINFVLKASTGAVGAIRTFYLFVYEDKFSFTPSQTWKIEILAVQRVDLSCVAGQVTRSSLILRGEHSSCLVQCLSDSDELLLQPSESFILTPFAVQELSLTLRCLLPGVGYFRLNLVDRGLEELIKSWLVVVSSQKPNVTKAFQVHLYQGKESVKRVSFENQYSESRQYSVLCSHPCLLHLKEMRFTVASKQSHSIGFHFLPPTHPFAETIFLYVCDDFGKTEATFCIKVSCE